MNAKCKRILMSIVGVTLCGMSAGIYKYAAFGVDPFQCFVFGVDAAVPIAYGTLYVLLNAGLLIFSLLADRRCGPGHGAEHAVSGICAAIHA